MQHYVMDQEGYYEAVPATVPIERFTSGPSVVKAFASGDVDVALFGISPAMVLVDRGTVAEEHGILADRMDEGHTSKTCSRCEQTRDSNRVERGLYVCSSCKTTMNADVNGAVNIWQKITQILLRGYEYRPVGTARCLPVRPRELTVQTERAGSL